MNCCAYESLQCAVLASSPIYVICLSVAVLRALLQRLPEVQMPRFLMRSDATRQTAPAARHLSVVRGGVS